MPKDNYFVFIISNKECDIGVSSNLDDKDTISLLEEGLDTIKNPDSDFDPSIQNKDLN